MGLRLGQLPPIIGTDMISHDVQPGPDTSRQRSGPTDRAALAAELEATRSAFHLLLGSVVDSVWDEQALGSAWTVREEMWHIAWGMQFMSDLIRNARRRIGLPRPPMRMADLINALYARVRGGRATPESIARRYDRIHAAVLGLLSEIQEDEWDKSVRVFGETQTIRELFQGISHHFDEHARRIRPLLGRE
jgi:hypothetical protein